MRLLIFFVTLAPAFAAPCRPADREHIIAADLAAEIEAFGQLDPQTIIGPAPSPGTHRTFSAHELIAIAERNGIRLGGTVSAACFERTLQPLTGERIRAAIQSTLGAQHADIEVVDFVRQPMPLGELVFARAGLIPPADANDVAVLWRGTLRYSPQHTLPVWARVRIRQQSTVVVAAHPIRSGAAIQPEDIALVRRDLSPFTPHLDDTAGVLGRVARRKIPAGAVISEALIEVPPDVVSGDTVNVIATTGSARITFDAVARSQGRKGDRILLLNPESRRTFRAIVDGRGRAHIGGEGL